MFWLSLIVFEDLISVELASWWTAAVGFILRPRPRFQSAHLKSDKPKATASQSSWPIVGIFCLVVLEEIHFMFSKKSTLCCRRNPSPGKQIVASFQPCSLFNVWWALNSRPGRNKTEFAALFPRVNYSTLSLRGNEFAFSSFFAAACLSCQPDRGIGGDIAGKRQLFAVIGSLITLRSRPLKQHRHCYLSSLDKAQKLLLSINPSARQLRTGHVLIVYHFLCYCLQSIILTHSKFFNQIKEGTSPTPSEPA